MELLCFGLRFISVPLLRCLFVLCLEEHLLEQVGMIEAFWIPLQKCHRSECALLRVQFAGFLKLQQRCHEKCPARVHDDDALSLFQRACKVDSLHRSADNHCGSDEKPNACEAVFVDEDAHGVAGCSVTWRVNRRRCGAQLGW